MDTRYRDLTVMGMTEMIIGGGLILTAGAELLAPIVISPRVGRCTRDLWAQWSCSTRG
jgi:hypothetical protein